MNHTKKVKKQHNKHLTYSIQNSILFFSENFKAKYSSQLLSINEMKNERMKIKSKSLRSKIKLVFVGSITFIAEVSFFSLKFTP